MSTGDKNNNQGKSLWDIVALAMSDYKKMANMLLIAIILLVALILGVLILVNTITSKGVDIIIEDNMTKIALNNKTIYQVLLHSSSIWEASKIKVKEGQKVKVKASGKININAGRTLQYAEIDSMPVFPWSNASGIQLRHFGLVESLACQEDIFFDSLQSNLIDPTARHGQLLSYIHHSDCIEDNRQNIEIENIIKGGSTFTFKSAKDGYLWFIVNDISLASNYKRFDKPELVEYVYSCRQTKNRKKRLEYIRRHNYWNAWFDDNIGSFLITVIIE